jgi:hypothetical protein
LWTGIETQEEMTMTPQPDTLLNALDAASTALNTAPRFRVPALSPALPDSYAVAGLLDRVRPMAMGAAQLTEQMLQALTAAESAIEEATDIMLFEDGEPVTALEGWEIERAYFALCSVLVEVSEAIDAARKHK